MAATDSTLDHKAMADARALLQPPARREALWPLLAAAGFAATSALALAVAMILAPSAVVEQAVRSTF